MGDPPKKKPKLKLEDTNIFENIRIGNSANEPKYYTARNDLPEGTGIVSLVVRAGFLCEEKQEAGTAHLLEHVLVRSVVEATGSLFGQRMFSHELHKTTHGYTIFSFQVRGESEYLEAIRLLKLIAKQEVLLTVEHIELEKKIVKIEYLTKLDGSTILTGDSLRAQILQTSSFATCLENLTKIKCADLTNFYHTWYIPSGMAFIVTGNLNTKEFLTELEEIAESESCYLEASSIDCSPGAIIAGTSVTSPSSPFEFLNDSYSCNALVFKVRRSSNLLVNVCMRMLVNATKQRLSEVGGDSYTIFEGSDVFIVLENDDPKTLIYEFLRLKEWGLTTLEMEREINLIKREMTREAKLFRLDKQHQINVLHEKLLDNFLYDVPVTSLDHELQLFTDSYSLQDIIGEFLGLLEIEHAKLYFRKSAHDSAPDSAQCLINEVKMQDMHQFKDKREYVRFEDRWACINTNPNLTRHYYNEFDMNEIKLSNGMRVLLKRSHVPPFDCAMKGFAFGGLSQQTEADYLSSFFGQRIVKMLPGFPLNLVLLGGHNLKIHLDVDDYMRKFESSFDISQLEVALQYVYLLFTEKPKLPDVSNNDPDVARSMRRAFDLWKLRRNTWRTVYEHATDSSYIHKVPNYEQFSEIDLHQATAFFNSCFSNPSEFTLVLVGDFDVDETVKLVQKYMGSIACAPRHNLLTHKSDITSFPINFPRDVLMREVYAEQPFKKVYICVPLKMDKEKQEEDKFFINILKIIALQKLTKVLRDDMGKVYSVAGSIYFDGKMHASPNSEEAILAVRFCCEAVEGTVLELAKITLKSIEDLKHALGEEDIACLPSFFVKPYVLQSKSLLDEIVETYQSNEYKGDLEKTITASRKSFQNILSIGNTNSWKQVFTRIMPDNCMDRYVCVVFHNEDGDDSYDENEEDGDDDSDEYLVL